MRPRRLDHSRAPLLEALADYHRQDRYGFTPPGHRQGRGADPRARDILGAQTYRADLLASAGLDDRSSSHRFLADAEQLMADAVGADQAFFSTAGSSLSVKAAMLAVAGGQGQLLIGRDAHKSVVAGLMDAGADVCVVSVHKMGAGFEQGSVLYSQGDLIDATHLAACADLLMTTSPNTMVYAAIDGWRRQMVEHGTRLLGDALALAGDVRARLGALDGLHVLRDELLHAEASHDLDPLQVLVDVSALDITGYQAADWLREHCRIDVGLSDHRRILATLSMADDAGTADRLVDAVARLVSAAPALPAAKIVDLPDPSSFEVEPVLTPRDAFFGPTRTVPIAEAVGQVCAEQITPYPPGIPALIPGERISTEIVDYLRTGLAAGMVLPDPADPALDTIRVALTG